MQDNDSTAVCTSVMAIHFVIMKYCIWSKEYVTTVFYENKEIDWKLLEGHSYMYQSDDTIIF